MLTYCILSNHFHILARVPPKQEVPDAELLRRYAILYNEDEVAALEESLASDARDRVREALLKRMHDVSFFMKELKMRFTIYYNNRYDRFGTLWAERFKSLLVESKGKRDAVLAVAAYIDLNPVKGAGDVFRERAAKVGAGGGGFERGEQALFRPAASRPSERGMTVGRCSRLSYRQFWDTLAFRGSKAEHGDADGRGDGIFRLEEAWILFPEFGHFPGE